MSMARGIAAAVALAACMLLTAATALAAKPQVAKRTIGAAGAPVPRSFAGFSIEYTSAVDYFGAPGKPNGAFIELLRTLGANGVGTPTIRLGGNSGDASWWNPDGVARPAGVDTDLTPAWLSTLRPMNEQAGARFVLGGNFAIADPSNAVSFVRAAVGTLPKGASRHTSSGTRPTSTSAPRPSTSGTSLSPGRSAGRSATRYRSTSPSSTRISPR